MADIMFYPDRRFSWLSERRFIASLPSEDRLHFLGAWGTPINQYRASHHHLHRLEVIPLDFEIRDLAISLRGLNPGMPKEIMDAHQIGIGIEKLGCHRMPELVT